MNSINSQIANKNNIQDLVEIGLTELEAKIYLLANMSSATNVKEISQTLNVMPSSVHRSIKTLKSKGLLISYGGKPLKIRAIDPSISLPALIETKRQGDLIIYNDLISKLKDRGNDNELKVQFLENKQATYENGIRLINNVKKDAIIFSIGESIPSELFLSFVRAIKRGVDVKMISQKFNKSNKELLSNLKKNGYKVRHLSSPELDFTLVVYDQKVSELHIRLPENPDNRVGIVIYNASYAASQYQYLMGLWSKAKDI